MKEAFSLASLDEVLASAILIEIIPSSGHFGPGGLQVFTESGSAHMARFPELDINGWWELDQIHPFFARKDTLDGWYCQYLAEENGWTYIERERLLVRDDFLEAFHAVYVVERKRPENKVRCIDIARMVRQALKL